MNTEVSQFTLTDDEISKGINVLSNSIEQIIKSKPNNKLYHKFFIDSIFSVKKPESQYELLSFLCKSLENGIYFIPIHDAGKLFQILFSELPNNENIQQNSKNMHELFKCMNIFILGFYNTLYPYFYDIDNDESIFSYDINFIINYFQMFCNAISGRCLNIYFLQEDGSITNILNYLFEQLINGVEYKKISKIIFKVFKLIDVNFAIQYIDNKKILSKSCAVYINHHKKSIYLMYYQINFYIKYIEKNYNLKCDRVGFYRNWITFSEDDKKKLIQTVNTIQDFLKSFLFYYTERLISEGRLINVSNPFNIDQIEIQTKSYKFYPEKVDDKILNEISNFIGSIIDISLTFKIPEIIPIIFPVVLSMLRIIPSLYLSNYFINTRKPFEYLKDLNTEKFNEFKRIFIETIRDRIVGNYKFDIDVVRKIYRDSSSINDDKIKNHLIFSFFQIILNYIDDSDDIFELLHLENIEDIIKIFAIFIDCKNEMIDLHRIDKRFFHILNYKNYNNPVVFPYYMQLILKLNEPGELSKYIRKVSNFILKEPKINNFIDQKLLLCFYSDISSYNFEPINDIDSIDSFIENLDLSKILILSKFLNKEKFIYFINKLRMLVISKLSKNEILDENIIPFAIAISNFLVSFKFEDEQIFKNIKICLSYLNNQKECYIINEYNQNQIEFSDSNDRAKINFICCLTNSYGFLIHTEYLSLISDLIEKYRMCIEVLHVISNIISYLIPFIEGQNISNECLSKTNEKIFNIVQTLIDNSLNNDNKDDDFNGNFQRFSKKKRLVERNKDFLFSLIKNIDNKSSNYYFSHKMNKDKNFDRYSKRKQLFFPYEEKFADSIASSFINNASDYSKFMINKFGDKIDFIDLFNKTIEFQVEFNKNNNTNSKGNNDYSSQDEYSNY